MSALSSRSAASTHPQHDGPARRSETQHEPPSDGPQEHKEQGLPSMAQLSASGVWKDLAKRKRGPRLCALAPQSLCSPGRSFRAA